MAQSGWRLPEDLLRRVRVRCAELGVRQNVFVERALEAALRVPSLDSLGPSPSPALVKAAVEESYKLPPSEPSPKPAVPKSRVASGVRPARDFVLDPRQAALNKAKGS